MPVLGMNSRSVRCKCESVKNGWHSVVYLYYGLPIVHVNSVSHAGASLENAKSSPLYAFLLKEAGLGESWLIECFSLWYRLVS